MRPLPDKLSDLLEEERFEQHYLSRATEWAPIDRTHDSALAFRQQKGTLWKDLNEFNITALDLLVAVYWDVDYPVLLVSLAPESSHQEESLKLFLQSSPWEELLSVKIYIQIGRPVLFNRREIKPGQSLSAQGYEQSQGTLGGPVVLGDKLYALTCHHVIYNPEIYPENQPVPANAIEKAVYVPSHRNYEERFLKLQDEVKQCRKRLEIFKSAAVEDPHYKKLPKQQLIAIEEEKRSSLEMAERNLANDILEHSNIGHVAFDCKGIRTVGWKGNRRTIDWTLVELNETTTIKPTIELDLKDDAWVSRLCAGGDYTALRDKVWKRGQTTLVTQGRLNGVYSPVRMFPKHPEIETAELMVVSETPETPFSRRGDSGAWVVNAKHELIGMVIGGTLKAPFRTYIADMRQVFEDIQDVTKMMPTLVAPGPTEEEIEMFKLCVILTHGLFDDYSPAIHILSRRIVYRKHVATLQVGDQFIILTGQCTDITVGSCKRD
jgi:hypothetical protein